MKVPKETVSVFGLGVVGLVTAVSFARGGYRVLGFDVDRARLEKIQNGLSPFFEPQLQEYLVDALRSERLSVTDDTLLNAKSEFAFVTVGTPAKEDGSINLEYTKKAAFTVGESLRFARNRQTVLIKSTVTPGTTRNCLKPIIEQASGKRAGKDFGLCSNPEFLREGHAIQDAEFPDRIIIGTDDQLTLETVERFYRELYSNLPLVLCTTYENAELIKYANNAYLATKISFINAIANIAERTPRADVKIISKGIGIDDRIGSKFLNAGIGWGGSCLPKDLKALVAHSTSVGYEPDLLQSVIHTNQKQAERTVHLANVALGSLRGKKVAVLGLAFKPETDDVREAVSISIIRNLLAEGAVVAAYDPAAMENARAKFNTSVSFASNAIECVTSTDCCIIATEWLEFTNLTPQIFATKMRHSLVIDGRRIYDPAQFINAGIEFYAIGLGPDFVPK